MNDQAAIAELILESRAVSEAVIDQLVDALQSQQSRIAEFMGLYICSDCGADGAEVEWCQPGSSYSMGHTASPDSPCGPMVPKETRHDTGRLKPDHV